jgi:hypothetical protein
MRDPRCLSTLQASTDCYRDSSTFTLCFYQLLFLAHVFLPDTKNRLSETDKSQNLKSQVRNFSVKINKKIGLEMLQKQAGIFKIQSNMWMRYFSVSKLEFRGCEIIFFSLKRRCKQHVKMLSPSLYFTFSHPVYIYELDQQVYSSLNFTHIQPINVKLIKC